MAYKPAVRRGMCIFATAPFIGRLMNESIVDGMRDEKNSNASLIARAICGLVLVVLFVALIKMQYTNMDIGLNYYLLVAVSILLSIYAVYVSYMCIKVLIERKGKRK